MSSRDDTLSFGDLIVRGWKMYIVVDPARGRDGETCVGAPRSEFEPGTLEALAIWLTPTILDDGPMVASIEATNSGSGDHGLPWPGTIMFRDEPKE